jgi:hypothetical protein
LFWSRRQRCRHRGETSSAVTLSVAQPPTVAIVNW